MEENNNQGGALLVNYILNAQHGKKIAVILNESGEEIGVERAMINEGESGSLVEEWVELANGCVCCTVKHSLVQALEQLVQRKERLDHILIETTGLADPAPLVSILWLDEQLESAIKLDSIITDVVILNKVDLVSPKQSEPLVSHALEELQKEISYINPLANIIVSVRCQVDLCKILDRQAYDAKHVTHLESLLKDSDLKSASSRHNSKMQTLSISEQRHVDLEKFRAWLEEILWEKKYVIFMALERPKKKKRTVHLELAIDEKIRSLDYSESRAEIKTVDAQESLNGGVLVLVTGYLTGKDNVKKNFTQSFFLAPQDKGYFVLNDIFQYVEDVEHHAEVNQGSPNGTGAPLASHPRMWCLLTVAVEEDVTVEEVYNPSDHEDGLVVEEETPEAEVVDEVPSDSEVVADYNPATVQEEAPKKSYASILSSSSGQECKVLFAIYMRTKLQHFFIECIILFVMAFTGALDCLKWSNSCGEGYEGSALIPARPTPANPERQLAPPPQNQAPEVPVSSSSATENGSNQEAEADGYSIYIRSLPVNATVAQLEEEFKKFGPIKSGGVQVRSNKQQGFCFGFVEF
ncbi:hypothetical protein H6P81_020709 [Aristolochia fimbriata]|uniref:Uncharacterized protein n=1 Tax=Aristolochia fimbriata TaxID=158543 RepID=A0AAV7DX14_ARIFI|nr:hypothetical protein H6P81_020709 [Aristolochia fimbriata]